MANIVHEQSGLIVPWRRLPTEVGFTFSAVGVNFQSEGCAGLGGLGLSGEGFELFSFTCRIRGLTRHTQDPKTLSSFVARHCQPRAP